jgi:hypothetical protein
MSDKRTNEKEIQRLASLSRIFVYKVAELIYSIRCPNELPDFSPDKCQFSLTIPQSASLRQHICSRLFHGYFKIDILLTNPEFLIERWYIEQLPPLKDCEMEFKKETKQIIYENFSSTLRSVYCLLNAMPAKALALQMSQIPTCERRITAFASDFKSLNDKPQPMEGRHVSVHRLEPIKTVVGRIVITCQYLTSLDNELPVIVPSSRRTVSSSSGSYTVKYVLVNDTPPSEVASVELPASWINHEPEFGSYVAKPIEREFFVPPEDTDDENEGKNGTTE